MPAELSITIDELRNELQRFQGFGRSIAWASVSANAQQDITAFIARGLRQFYYPPPLPGEASSHKWSFLKKQGTFLFPAPLAPTPTCTVVNGVVTFASAANLTSALVRHSVVTFASLEGYYEVDTATSTTVCTLKDLSVNIVVATTATFYYNRIDMPATGIDLNVFHKTASGNVQLRNVNSEYILNIQQDSMLSHIGTPVMFSIEPSKWVVANQTQQEWHMRVYPFCQTATALTLNYTVIPQTLQTTGDFPLGGMAHYETILVSCLAVAEEYGDTPSSKYRELFMQRLAASVMADRTGMYAGNLGYNGDNSDPLGRRQVRDFTVTYTP